MQLHIRHETVYATSTRQHSVQTLRLTPRTERASACCVAHHGARPQLEQVDAHGNLTHLLTLETPHHEIRIVVEASRHRADDARNRTMPPLVGDSRRSPTCADDADAGRPCDLRALAARHRAARRARRRCCAWRRRARPSIRARRHRRGHSAAQAFAHGAASARTTRTCSSPAAARRHSGALRQRLRLHRHDRRRGEPRLGRRLARRDAAGSAST